MGPGLGPRWLLALCLLAPSGAEPLERHQKSLAPLTREGAARDVSRGAEPPFAREEVSTLSTGDFRFSSTRVPHACPADAMTCSLMGAKTSSKNNAKKADTSSCMCSKMAYVLATYSPSGSGGANALTTVCHWWDLMKFFGLKPTDGAENGYIEKCNTIARTMMQSTYSTSGGWKEALKSCCYLYACASVFPLDE